MRTSTAVIARDQETGLFVGYITGWPGAHSQGETRDELQANLREVVDLLLEDGEPAAAVYGVPAARQDVRPFRV